jgi:hypothetical protein
VTPAPTHATGADLLAYWTSTDRAGLLSPHTAAIYRSAVRRVLAAQPQGDGIDITAAPSHLLARFTNANQGVLAEKTLVQYASNFRCARRIYLAHLAAGSTSHFAIGLDGGRFLTVTTPGPLTDAERRLALTTLAERWAPAPETGQGAASTGEQSGTAP